MSFSFPYPEIDLHREVLREEFAKTIAAPIDKILNKMDEVIAQAKVRDDEIDLIYCTGGTSRLDGIQTILLKRFGPERVRSNKYFHSVIDGLGARARQLLTDER